MMTKVKQNQDEIIKKADEERHNLVSLETEVRKLRKFRSESKQKQISVRESVERKEKELQKVMNRLQETEGKQAGRTELEAEIHKLNNKIKDLKRELTKKTKNEEDLRVRLVDEKTKMKVDFEEQIRKLRAEIFAKDDELRGAKATFKTEVVLKKRSTKNEKEKKEIPEEVIKFENEVKNAEVKEEKENR